MISTDRIEQLIKKGEDVLKTHSPNPPNIIGFPTLDSGQFTAWKTQVLNFLKSNLTEDSQYLLSFQENVGRSFRGEVNQGIGILKSLLEDINLDLISGQKEVFKPLTSLITIFDRFHIVSRQLRNRYNSRSTLNVLDEYDVQDLLHSLLKIYFDDIRAEEWTPSYAGKSSRMDFLLKDYNVVVEVKKTRSGLTGKEVGTQLIEDIKRYQQHLNCETLMCFVYDPEGLIGNPRGLENDLSSDNEKFKVKVYVRP